MRLDLTPSSFLGPFFMTLGSSSVSITTSVFIGMWFLSTAYERHDVKALRFGTKLLLKFVK